MKQSRRGFIGRVGAIFAAPLVAGETITRCDRRIPLGVNPVLKENKPLPPKDMVHKIWHDSVETYDQNEDFFAEFEGDTDGFIRDVFIESVFGQTPRLKR